MVLSVVLVPMATLYLTYVVTRSEFPLVLGLRDRVFQRWREGSWQAYLATCAWCAAVYVATLVTLGTEVFGDVPAPVLTVLMSAAVTSIGLEVVDTLWSIREGK